MLLVSLKFKARPNYLTVAKKTEPEQLFEILPGRVLIDVRTPAEFAAGHIPGSVNLPLFTNEERAEIGTIYKQVNPELAFLKGLERVGPKMRGFVETALKLAPDKKLAIHCWRGGQRSESMGWLFEKSGFDVIVLNGGYKAWRRHVLEYLSEPPFTFMVVGGYTGSGKTAVLRALMEMGETVVDLEGLAHHKGSAFGALGEQAQPTVEQFENDLWSVFQQLPPGRTVWLEDESKSIGRVYLPEGFWRKLLASTMIQLVMPIELRVERLVEEYGAFSREDLAECFQKIVKRTGGQNLNAALEALDRNDLAAAAEVALKYYDKTYNHTLERPGRGQIIRMEIKTKNPEEIARSLAAGPRLGLGGEKR